MLGKPEKLGTLWHGMQDSSVISATSEWNSASLPCIYLGISRVTGLVRRLESAISSSSFRWLRCAENTYDASRIPYPRKNDLIDFAHVHFDVT